MCFGPENLVKSEALSGPLWSLCPAEEKTSDQAAVKLAAPMKQFPIQLVLLKKTNGILI